MYPASREWAYSVLRDNQDEKATQCDLEDGGVVYKPIYGGQRHCRIPKHAVPFAERLIGRDHERTPFISRTDQLEED